MYAQVHSWLLTLSNSKRPPPTVEMVVMCPGSRPPPCRVPGLSPGLGHWWCLWKGLNTTQTRTKLQPTNLNRIYHHEKEKKKTVGVLIEKKHYFCTRSQGPLLWGEHPVRSVSQVKTQLSRHHMKWCFGPRGPVRMWFKDLRQSNGALSSVPLKYINVSKRPAYVNHPAPVLALGRPSVSGSR